MKWIKDEEIIRESSPMTKYPIRILSLSMMDLEEECSFLDIGCGTGSISLQAAAIGAKVTAMDMKDEAVETTKKNFDKFAVKGYVYKGKAPEDLFKKKFQRIFMGGSTGNIKKIVDYIDNYLTDDGITLANFIIQENAVDFKRELLNKGFKVEVRTINHAIEDALGLNKADNPVIIVKGVRK